MVQRINAGTQDVPENVLRAELEQEYGKVWTTYEMSEEFDVSGFMAPLIIVTRKSDGRKGSLKFTHQPRFYFDFQPYNG